MSKPEDESGPRDPYFLAMQDALITAGIATPTLLIDLDRLNSNIETLMQALPKGMEYRVVAKSLPSIGLIGHVMERTGTNRLMTFNLPMLQAITAAMPAADQLLGKPLPAAAMRAYFDTLPTQLAGAAQQIQWLVDTPARLAQYTQIGRDYGAPLRINIELDVGLHRGGFVPGEALANALHTIADTDGLTLSGFMGYEPHVAKLPTALGWRDRALEGAWALYGEAMAQAAAIFGDDAARRLVRNAAGSPTYRFYKNTDIANEVSVGSALVKPTDFDTPMLAPHIPAAFIATPVLKAMEETITPGLEFADAAQRAWDPNLDKTIFTYGGRWMAQPVDPPGLRYNAVFGRSSNQEMMNGGPGLEIAVDDFVFLRPTQSEAVFLQFGDIAVYEEGAITRRWPVFPASA